MVRMLARLLPFVFASVVTASGFAPWYEDRFSFSSQTLLIVTTPGYETWLGRAAMGCGVLGAALAVAPKFGPRRFLAIGLVGACVLALCVAALFSYAQGDDGASVYVWLAGATGAAWLLSSAWIHRFARRLSVRSSLQNDLLSRAL